MSVAGHYMQVAHGRAHSQEQGPGAKRHVPRFATALVMKLLCQAWLGEEVVVLVQAWIQPDLAIRRET